MKDWVMYLIFTLLFIMAFIGKGLCDTGFKYEGQIILLSDIILCIGVIIYLRILIHKNSD